MKSALLPLCNGTTSASFMASGKIPSVSDLLNSNSNGAKMHSFSSLSSLLLILSCPLLVLFGNFFISNSISLCVVG